MGCPHSPEGWSSPGHWGAEDDQLPLPHPEVKQCLPQDGTPHPGWAGREHPTGCQQQCTPLLTPTPSPDARTPGNRAARTAGTRPAPPVQLSSRTHTRAHRTGMHQLCPACQGGHEHWNTYANTQACMYIHTCVQLRLCANANLGTCVFPVLLLHPARSMQILLVRNCATEIPSPGPKVPKAVPLAMQSLGFGEQHHPAQTAIPHCASSHASLAQPLVPALAVTCRSGCLTPLALPSMRRSSPLGANPAREPFPRLTQPSGQCGFPGPSHL